jgi:hypothetical protein
MSTGVLNKKTNRYRYAIAMWDTTFPSNRIVRYGLSQDLKLSGLKVSAAAMLKKRKISEEGAGS